jgi:cardiolipin synthase
MGTLQPVAARAAVTTSCGTTLRMARDESRDETIRMEMQQIRCLNLGQCGPRPHEMVIGMRVGVELSTVFSHFLWRFLRSAGDGVDSVHGASYNRSPFAPMVNLPNILTILRILCVPVFINLLIYGRFDYALALFLIAAATDGLDGLIARVTKQRSLLGMYLDPLADKVLLTSAFITLSVLHYVPIWLTTIVVSRDLILALGTLLLQLLNLRVDITPTWLGKATTVLQLGYVVIHLALVALASPDGLLLPAALLVTVVTVVSGLHYIYRAIRTLRAETAVP